MLNGLYLIHSHTCARSLIDFQFEISDGKHTVVKSFDTEDWPVGHPVFNATIGDENVIMQVRFVSLGMVWSGRV